MGSKAGPNSEGNGHVLSTKDPTPNDLTQSAKLQQFLQTQKLFETEKEEQTRRRVLKLVGDKFKNWILETSRKKNIQDSNVGGKVETFGSYRLGVHHQGADIDIVGLAPRHIERHEFFSSFKEQLQKTVPENTELTESLLLNMDERCIRSVNGCRVADEILKMVPNKVEFANCLIAIKLWAKNRGLYSNILGFLGGVSWSILVAKICQMYPKAPSAVLFHRFFFFLVNWEWPKPVYLYGAECLKRNNRLDEFMWDCVTRITDRNHLMPILTPAYPQQNSTFNVTSSSLKIMMDEFRRTKQSMEEMRFLYDWDKLFEKVEFFSRYRIFAAIVASARNEEEQLVFNGFVESRIRHLLSALELNYFINFAHVNPMQYKLLRTSPIPHYETREKLLTAWFVGLDGGEGLNIDVLHATEMHLALEHFSQTVEMQAMTSSMGRKYSDNIRLATFFVPQEDLKRFLDENDLVIHKKPRMLHSQSVIFGKNRRQSGVNKSASCSAFKKDESTSPSAEELNNSPTGSKEMRERLDEFHLPPNGSTAGFSRAKKRSISVADPDIDQNMDTDRTRKLSKPVN